MNGTDFQCECRNGYEGDTCDLHPCDLDPCMNEGVCEPSFNITRIEDKAYQCKCPFGYTGVHCEIHPCSNVDCSNFGTCKIEENGSHTCECFQGYSGIV